MTQEEIRKQIERAPIRWKETGYHKDGDQDLKATIVLIPEDDEPEEDHKLYLDFSISSSRKNQISELYISAHGRWDFGMYEIAKSTGIEIPVDQLKKLAEEERFKMACRLLRIKE
jgi:hypothetical protein